jgi:hypothetical protein
VLGLPRTLIAKFSTPDPEVRAAIHSMGFYRREAARFIAACCHHPTACARLRYCCGRRDAVDA